jgi:hypothetical protein
MNFSSYRSGTPVALFSKRKETLRVWKRKQKPRKEEKKGVDTHGKNINWQ